MGRTDQSCNDKKALQYAPATGTLRHGSIAAGLVWLHCLLHFDVAVGSTASSPPAQTLDSASASAGGKYPA